MVLSYYIEMYGLRPKELAWVERWNAHTQQSAQKCVWNVSSLNGWKHHELGSGGSRVWWKGAVGLNVPWTLWATDSPDPTSSETTKPWRHWRHPLSGNIQDLLIQPIENCFNTSLFFLFWKELRWKEWEPRFPVPSYLPFGSQWLLRWLLKAHCRGRTSPAKCLSDSF